MEAFFAPLQPGASQRRFCLWHAPAKEAPRSLLVHVHAFAEEMNKSRRMAAMQSRAFAAAGHAVLQFDLLGCGDSDGDFGDATWDAWVADVLGACELAQAKVAKQWPDATPQLWLWGHRAGCLLAHEALAQMAERGDWNLLCWQPTPKGKTVLQQFLRLETAGALMGKSNDKPSAKASLAAGQAAEIAGYLLQPALAQGLEAANLAPLGEVKRLVWIDVAPQADAVVSPVTQATLEAWTAAGCAVQHRQATGPSFWQTTEIEDAPALIDTTLSALTLDPAAATPIHPTRQTPDAAPAAPGQALGVAA